MNSLLAFIFAWGGGTFVLFMIAIQLKNFFSYKGKFSSIKTIAGYSTIVGFIFSTILLSIITVQNKIAMKTDLNSLDDLKQKQSEINAIKYKEGQCYKISDFLPSNTKYGYTLKHTTAGIQPGDENVTRHSSSNTYRLFRNNNHSYQQIECISNSPMIDNNCRFENATLVRTYTIKNDTLVLTLTQSPTIGFRKDEDDEILKFKSNSEMIKGGDKIEYSDKRECIVVDPCLEVQIKQKKFHGIAVACLREDKGEINYYLNGFGLNSPFATTENFEIHKKLDIVGEISEYGGSQSEILDIIP